MRILWLSGNASLYTERTKGYNSGGWIGALEREISKYPEIELGICFLHHDDCFKKVIDKTTYYPVKLYNTKLEKIHHNLFYEKYDQIEITKLLKVIDDFNPDVIHVWGTEISFGLISKYTQIPTVIHLQGILNPVYNALFIPALSKEYFLKHAGRGIFKNIFNIQFIRIWKHNMKRELEIFKICQNFIGRTDWDKNISQLLAPDSSYYYCGELLRSHFYQTNAWQPHQRQKLIVTSVLSNPPYKGIDVILKCANILKQYGNIDFEWNIFGVIENRFAEKLTGIQANEVKVLYKGIASAESLINELLESDVFVHSSYIDNSSNSVCEAQTVGIPVISTNVGGISSLIINNETGILVPANDPYYLASQILGLFKDKKNAKKIGANGRIEALKRHNNITIINDLINVYAKVQNKN